jgi:hypothetical protein
MDGSAGGNGGGVARVSTIDEGGGDGSVRGTSGPWDQPLGPMVIHATRQIVGAPTGPLTTVMWHSSAYSLASSP